MEMYHFRYRVADKDLQVLIKSDSMNNAMIFFAENYHEINHVYGIFKLPITNP